MKKQPIGILDGGFEGINIFESLSKNFPNEYFVYINDPKNYPYEGKEEKLIHEYVKKNIDKLLSLEVKCIICVNASIIEYCEEMLKEINVPTILLVDSIIDYVNLNFEQKNMVILAKEYILKANLFQKNFKYNHLYNVASDDFEDVIFDRKVRTAKSFEKTRELLKSVIAKDVDLFIIVDSYLENLNIEFKEYCNYGSFINLSSIIGNEMLTKLSNLYNKGKGKRLVISNIEKNEFVLKAYWISKFNFELIGE